MEEQRGGSRGVEEGPRLKGGDVKCGWMHRFRERPSGAQRQDGWAKWEKDVEGTDFQLYRK